MNDAEYQMIREEYAVLDNKNGQQLREFFLRYSFLETTDFSVILGLSTTAVRKLKRLAGFRRTSAPDVVPNVSARSKIVENIEPFVDTASWWILHYKEKGCGRVKLKRASGLNFATVYKRIKQHCGWRSNSESTKSKHPCNTIEWLTRHYIDKEMSMRACARQAGVSDDTLKVWLLRAGITIRHKNHGPIVGKDRSKQSG